MWPILDFPISIGKKEIIRLTQVKTGNPLELPLLEDVGEAIINYLKKARPKTDSGHVFVR